jgi:hypothetical protein
MRVTLKDQIESVHQWIGDDGKVKRVVITGKAGDMLDSDAMGCGDPERALRKLVELGLAE